MLVSEFCKINGAWGENLEWAMSQGVDTIDDLWNIPSMPPIFRRWIATRPGVMSDRDLRLFACWCVRQVWSLLEDERSRNVVEVAELHAAGAATDARLRDARTSARDAVKHSVKSVRASAWAADHEETTAARAAAWAASGMAANAAINCGKHAVRAAADAEKTLDASRATWAAAEESQSQKLLDIMPVLDFE